MISKRLVTIASMVPENTVVFDVGSDHALLPCYLVEKGISSKVYAGDNKKGPLESARKNIQKYGFENNISAILSDGLDKAPSDTETVVISGMGFHTVYGILEKADLRKYKCFIVQINKNPGMLRRYISLHNYTITNEKIVHEDFYYEIIAFNTDFHEEYSEDEIEFGPLLLKEKSEIFIESLRFRIRNLENIIELKGDDKIIEEKIKKLKNIIEPEC